MGEDHMTPPTQSSELFKLHAEACLRVRETLPLTSEQAFRAACALFDAAGLLTRAAAMARDAERYRWLRSDALDEAIDSAMAAQDSSIREKEPK